MRTTWLANKRNWVQFALVAFALLLFVPRSSAQTVTCSSDDMRRHYCQADTRGGVQLLQQRSGSVCREGYSWGFDRNGIWVDHGCRADFAVSAYQGGQGYPGGPGYPGGVNGANTITCSSDDMRRHYCEIDTSGGVQLLNQRSQAACRQGYSWGYDRNRIWVDHGCRADFTVSSYGNGARGRGRALGRRNRGEGIASTITCSSDDGRRHYCQTDTRGGVRLLNQRSGSVCREGYSWGSDGNGVWVDHGCRADFEVRR